MKTAISTGADVLIELQRRILPSDEVLDPCVGFWWVVRDGGEPVAFAALRDVPSWPQTGYMARCGVLPKYRGRGLQRHLLTVREKMARRLGLLRVISTTYNNPTSANNLIARGYRTYEPAQRWGAKETIYWVKAL
jgi:GNAT superfamily N-acetyltransferase